MTMTVSRLRTLLDNYASTAKVSIAKAPSGSLIDSPLPTASINQAGTELELAGVHYSHTTDDRGHLAGATVTLVIKD